LKVVLPHLWSFMPVELIRADSTSAGLACSVALLVYARHFVLFLFNCELRHKTVRAVKPYLTSVCVLYATQSQMRLCSVWPLRHLILVVNMVVLYTSAYILYSLFLLRVFRSVLCCSMLKYCIRVGVLDVAIDCCLMLHYQWLLCRGGKMLLTAEV